MFFVLLHWHGESLGIATELWAFITSNYKALLIALSLLEVVLEVVHVGRIFAEFTYLAHVAEASLCLILASK